MGLPDPYGKTPLPYHRPILGDQRIIIPRPRCLIQKCYRRIILDVHHMIRPSFMAIIPTLLCGRNHTPARNIAEPPSLSKIQFNKINITDTFSR